MKFSIKDFSSKCDEICGFGDITEEILNGKLHFLCCEMSEKHSTKRNESFHKIYWTKY